MVMAVILAGGTGTRIGASVPKQFIEIGGKPILVWTLEIFQRNREIDAIEIVCHKDWMDHTRSLVERYGLSKVRFITEGGSSYQESFMKGIFNLKEVLKAGDIVVSSFGVSPMTTDDIIADNLRVCRAHGNAIASADETLCTCIKDDEESSVTPILRETLKGFANPWSFEFSELVEAYETGLKTGILDTLEPHTTSLYFALGKRIWFSKTNTLNIKITTPEDLDIFEGQLLLREKRQREGRKEVLK